MVTENRTIQIHLVVHLIRFTIGSCTINDGARQNAPGFVKEKEEK
jgi:hypothetical protein